MKQEWGSVIKQVFGGLYRTLIKISFTNLFCMTSGVRFSLSHDEKLQTKNDIFLGEDQSITKTPHFKHHILFYMT